MKLRMILMAAVAMCVGAVAQANTLKQGAQEFGLSGYFDSETGSGADFQIGLTYGTFIMDNLELGGRVDYGDNDDATFFAVGPFCELDFDLGNELMPFVGGGIEFVYGDTIDESHNALALTGYAGAQYFLAENVAIGAQLELSAATDEVYRDTEGGSNYDIRLTFGLSYYVP